MKVELFYFVQCPHWKVLNERLVQALELSALSTRVEYRLIETVEEAHAANFMGSPSVHLNGRDPFVTTSAQVGLTCRVYATPTGPAGSPTLEQVLSAIHAQLGR